jgi:hypothetical protein
MGVVQTEPSRVGYSGRVRLRLNPLAVTVLAVLAVVARVPDVTRPLSPDEGGFLMVGGQWSPGSSLYGDYWVDRPPLIIAIFGLADHLGGAVPLRLFGMVAVAAAVVLAGLLGHLAAPGRRWTATMTAATAAVFLTTPLFGTREVNGELLAAPVVLGGLVAVLLAVRGGTRGALWWLVAGGLAACAVAIKQSMGDVVIASLAALAWQLRVAGVRRAAYGALGLAAGAVGVLLVLLGLAALRGTDPRSLWEAAVSFRLQASAVISADQPGSTTRRLHSMLEALRHSGAPWLVLLPLLPVARARLPGPLPLMTAAVLLWEAVAVAGGGSYWWHYLIGLVPGLVLLVATLARHRPGLQPMVAVVLGYAVFTGAQTAVDYPGLSRTQRDYDRAAAFLAAHARPGDTGVVAYGVASILQRAGVHSPYPYLWSLPVRVRDPELRLLTDVLRSRARPTWVVVRGDSLDSWAIDATTAQEALDERYRLAGGVGDWRFFRAVDAPPGAMAR